MSYIHLHARRTGRTSRLIEDAIEGICEGRAVYILCINATHVSIIRDAFKKAGSELGFALPKQPKFETLESLGMGNIDWKNTKIINAHVNCKLLIDHQVYEHLFGHIINGYHEYDHQIAVNSKWANKQLRR